MRVKLFLKSTESWDSQRMRHLSRINLKNLRTRRIVVIFPHVPCRLQGLSLMDFQALPRVPALFRTVPYVWFVHKSPGIPWVRAMF